MKKTLSSEAIRGLPDLKIVEGNICSEFQIDKQTRMSHPSMEHQVTSKVLELLHQDLMGPRIWWDLCKLRALVEKDMFL